MVLEGGYNHRQQAVCVQRCVEVLLGSIPPVNLTGHRVKQRYFNLFTHISCV